MVVPFALELGFVGLGTTSVLVLEGVTLTVLS